jgi:hypothetical protein
LLWADLAGSPFLPASAPRVTMESVWEAYRASDGAEEDRICGLAGCKCFVGKGVIVLVYRALRLSDIEEA